MAASAERSQPIVVADAARSKSRRSAAIRPDRRVGEPALDVEIGEVVLDRPVEVHAERSPPAADGPGAPRLGAIEQLARRGERRSIARTTAEHRRKLDDATLAVEPLHFGHGAAVTFPFDDPIMRVGVGRDLRQVRDAQHLMTARQAPQRSPDRLGAAPADPRVDLVEDERGGRVGFGEDALDRQGDPGQFAARGDLRQRSRRLAGVRREPVDDFVDAAGVEGDGVAIDSRPPASPSPPARRPTATSNTPAGKPELLEHLGDSGRERRPR